MLQMEWSFPKKKQMVVEMLPALLRHLFCRLFFRIQFLKEFHSQLIQFLKELHSQLILFLQKLHSWFLFRNLNLWWVKDDTVNGGPGIGRAGVR